MIPTNGLTTFATLPQEDMVLSTVMTWYGIHWRNGLWRFSKILIIKSESTDTPALQESIATTQQFTRYKGGWKYDTYHI